MTDFNGVYKFISGPMVWIAFMVFLGGVIYKLWEMFSLVNKKEKFIYSYMSLKYSLRSILHWIIPFATTNWRKRPLLTVVTFLFHLSLVFMPIFLSAHVLLFQNAWGIRWWMLPDAVSDALTVIVIIGSGFFLFRRMIKREVRYLTALSDYVVLAIAVAPFITGFLAYHQYLNYRFMLSIHILSGEIMLMAIPFSRLSHMIYSVFTRAYLGSEFGGVRHARDW